jgi:PPOX class probable FMN-dependent enzyme
MRTIETNEELRALYGTPSERAIRKQLAHIDKHCRHFIERSPFLVIASMGPNGADVSPRGDPPGFVAVLDEKRLLIPDRAGNNRIDSLANLVADPRVGLLFFLPGVDETLRINGRARVVVGAEVEAMALGGKAPRTALLVEVEEVFLQCAKALIRSKLWDPATRIERKSFPSFGTILADQMREGDPATIDRSIDEAYRTRLY